MTDDPDLQLIAKAANSATLEDGGQEFLRTVICHCYGLAYQANVHPSTIAVAALANVAQAMGEMTAEEWRLMQTRIADLLEREAHEEIA